MAALAHSSPPPALCTLGCPSRHDARRDPFQGCDPWGEPAAVLAGIPIRISESVTAPGVRWDVQYSLSGQECALFFRRETFAGGLSNRDSTHQKAGVSACWA